MENSRKTAARPEKAKPLQDERWTPHCWALAKEHNKLKPLLQETSKTA